MVLAGHLEGGIVSEGTNGFRRFSDKVMYSACGLVLVLVTALWGVTWKTTASDVDKIKAIQQTHAERITTTETNMQNVQRDVTEIKGDVKIILREVKK
jgi:hypothetical protein